MLFSDVVLGCFHQLIVINIHLYVNGIHMFFMHLQIQTVLPEGYSDRQWENPVSAQGTKSKHTHVKVSNGCQHNFHTVVKAQQLVFMCFLTLC